MRVGGVRSEERGEKGVEGLCVTGEEIKVRRKRTCRRHSEGSKGDMSEGGGGERGTERPSDRQENSGGDSIGTPRPMSTFSCYFLPPLGLFLFPTLV